MLKLVRPMEHPDDDPMTTEGSIKKATDAIGLIASVLVVAGTLGGAFVWMTGGFAPNTQVQYQSLNEKVTTLQSTLNVLNDKFNSMPRPSDWAAQELHLSHIDGQISALGERLTADEIRNASVAASQDARTQRLLDNAVPPQR